MSKQQPFLNKGLGQHHLVDGRLCRPLVEFLRPADRRVVEIGAGGGVLTAELLAAGGRVVACELDLAWACELSRRLAAPDLTILVLDALRIEWTRLRVPTLVAGNLPFSAATRLILSLLPHASRVPRAAFMVQKEVAERMVAGPGDPAYGSFSVLVSAHAEACYLGTVRPGSFRPPPKVAAALVGLKLAQRLVGPAGAPGFARLVRLAFARRRKTLRNSLAAGLGRATAEAILHSVGLDERSRAQELDLTAFLELYQAYRRLKPGPEPRA